MHFAKGQVSSPSNIDEHPRSPRDRDIVEQWTGDGLLRRFNRSILAAPDPRPHKGRPAALHHRTHIGEVDVHKASHRDEGGDPLRRVQQHFIGLLEGAS